KLSIVGLPDEGGVGEKVACLCVPEYKDPHDKDGPLRSRDEVRKELEEHFREVSAGMPFYRRVKVLRLWDGELPKTSTRKVKRKLVVEELKRQERIATSSEKVRQQTVATSGGVADWLYPLIAEVSQRPGGAVKPDAQLAGDLGFDSLMLTELSVALENAGVPLPAVSDLTQIQTVDDLRKLVAQSGRRAPEAKRAPVSEPPTESERDHGDEIPVPEALSD